MGFCRCLLMFCVLWSTSVAVPRPKFSPSNVVVYFDPSLNDVGRSHDYSIEELTPLISTIATKFSRIMSPYYFTFVNISSAIATFNKLRHPQQTPLELILAVPLTDPQVDSVRTNFEMAKKLADEANIIFPGTVKRLVVRHHSLNTGLANSKAYLANIYRGFDHSKYILGADLLFTDCGGTSNPLPTHLTQFLPYFKELIFAYWLDYEKTENGPFATAALVSKTFEHCVEKIERENGEVSVGLAAAWYKASEQDNPQQSLHLVQYWELMNQLAIKLNKTVILFEAFDTGHRPIRHRQQGWWKLENASYYNSSQFVFEEKWKAVQHLLPAIESRKDDEINSTSLDTTTSFSNLITASPDSTTFLPNSTISYSETTTFVPDSTTKMVMQLSGSQGALSKDMPVEDQSDSLIFDPNLSQDSSLKTSHTSTTTSIDWKTLTIASATIIILITASLGVLYFCRSWRRKNTSATYGPVFFRS